MVNAVFDEKDKARFYAKFRVNESGCWLWSGNSDKNGYGKFKVSKGGASRQVRAHRASWALHNGAIPNGLFVCHFCDVPACVNPAHLFLGSNADNVKDKLSKGRHGRGEACGTSKLKEGDISFIRSKQGIISCHYLAKQFGVSHQAILRVWNRDTWRHVP